MKNINKITATFLILSSEGIEARLDENAQRLTWASKRNPRINVMWLIGDELEKQPHLDSGRTLHVPIKEEFSNILAKTILGLQFAIENFDTDFYIRSNTSSYFNLHKVSRLLELLDRNNIEVGGYQETFRLKNESGEAKQERFINGAGIFLSRNAAKCLATLNPGDYLGIPDDVAISRFLSEKGFKLNTLPRNNLCYHRIFFPRAHIRVKGWQNRELTRTRMLLIDQYFQSKNSLHKSYAWIAVMKNEMTSVRDKGLMQMIKNFIRVLKSRP